MIGSNDYFDKVAQLTADCAKNFLKGEGITSTVKHECKKSFIFVDGHTFTVKPTTAICELIEEIEGRLK